MALRPVDRWEWLDLIRRARLGRTTKLVAVMLALYANEDGSKVFPGVARLSVVCELGYNTVKEHLAILRRLGWIERVSHAGSRGRADEYRLTVNDDEQVPSPGWIDAMVERTRSKKAGPLAERQPGARAEVDGETEAPQPVSQAEVEPDRQGTSARRAGHGDPTSARLTGIPQPGARAATNHVPRPTTTPDHPQTDLRTAVTVAREAEAATNSDSDVVADETPAGPPLPVRCEHNLVSRRRADGRPSCALCRVGVPASGPGEHLARVIPINRTQEAS